MGDGRIIRAEVNYKNWPMLDRKIDENLEFVEGRQDRWRIRGPCVVLHCKSTTRLARKYRLQQKGGRYFPTAKGAVG